MLKHQSACFLDLGNENTGPFLRDKQGAEEGNLHIPESERKHNETGLKFLASSRHVHR